MQFDARSGYGESAVAIDEFRAGRLRHAGPEFEQDLPGFRTKQGVELLDFEAAFLLGAGPGIIEADDGEFAFGARQFDRFAHFVRGKIKRWPLRVGAGDGKGIKNPE